MFENFTVSCFFGLLDDGLEFTPRACEKNLEIEFVVFTEKSAQTKSVGPRSLKLLNIARNVNEILAYLKLLVALALRHPEHKLLPAYFDIIGDIEVEFANGDGHAGEGLTFGEVGLDGVPVFVEFMVAWVREVRPLWMEKR